MSEPIKVGDLVQIVRPSTGGCGCDHNVGHIFVVTSIIEVDHGACRRCGHVTDRPFLCADGYLFPINLQRLKRIPPLGELNDVKKDEEITA